MGQNDITGHEEEAACDTSVTSLRAMNSLRYYVMELVPSCVLLIHRSIAGTGCETCCDSLSLQEGAMGLDLKPWLHYRNYTSTVTAL